MKKLFYIPLMLFFAAVGLVACGEDKGEDGAKPSQTMEAALQGTYAGTWSVFSADELSADANAAALATAAGTATFTANGGVNNGHSANVAFDGSALTGDANYPVKGAAVVNGSINGDVALFNTATFTLEGFTPDDRNTIGGFSGKLSGSTITLVFTKAKTGRGGYNYVYKFEGARQ